MKLFISCPTNIEALLVSELKTLGIPSQAGFRGVFAERSLENVYRINYCSRLATRVLWPLKTFSCKDRSELYNMALSIPWQDYLTPSLSFAIDANVSDNLNFRNSLFAALVVKDAICDTMRKYHNERPSVDIKNPDIQLHLFIHKNQAIISFDTSGSPLYKRGWRSDGLEAPLQESLAAAILLWGNYSPSDYICDPCCGSGTFLVEAALMQTNTPPGFKRARWGFLHLPNHKAELWQKIRSEVDRAVIPLQPGSICGADQNAGAARRAQEHCRSVGFSIQIACSEVSRYRPLHPPTLVIANLPYGRRLATSMNLVAEIQAFANQHKARSIIIAPEDNSYPHTKQLKFMNGGISVCAFFNKASA